ncbi:MAG: protease complex subunit PrcB family protein [Candidatus Lernaella stagnicola]|nr:protease complex subunit PrcB family protein [Candidatus Lernaella stagnicola]
MNHDRLEQQLAEYIDGTLSPQEHAEVEAHLAENPELTEQLRLIRRLHPMVRSLPDEGTPPDMTDSILRATTRRRPVYFKDRVRGLSKSFRPLSAIAAVFVAIVISVALFGYLRLTDPLMEQAPLALSFNDTTSGEQQDLSRPAKDGATGALVEAINHIDPDGGYVRDVRVLAPPVASALKEQATRDAEIMADTAAKAGAKALTKAAPRKEPYRSPHEDIWDSDLGLRPVVFGKYPRGAKGSGSRNVGGLATTERKKAKSVPPPTPRLEEPVAEKKAKADEDAPAAKIVKRWQGYHCGVTKRAAIIATNTPRWNKLWRLLTAHRIPPAPMPQVDFDQFAVVGVFMGLHSTGGFAVEILDIKREGDKLVLVIRETTPHEGQGVTMALTQPFSVVMIPREIDGLTVNAATSLDVVRE